MAEDEENNEDELEDEVAMSWPGDAISHCTCRALSQGNKTLKTGVPLTSRLTSDLEDL